MGFQNEESIWNLVEAKKKAFLELADRVFDTPETLYKEFRSVEEHLSVLKAETECLRYADIRHRGCR